MPARLELDKLPERIIFVGGGYISFEFAHLAARSRAQVKILHRSPRALTGFDPDLVDTLIQASKGVGIDIELNTPVQAIEQSGKGFVIHSSVGEKKQTFEADLVVHGAGRVPEISDLDLEQAGVNYDKKGKPQVGDVWMNEINKSGKPKDVPNHVLKKINQPSGGSYSG